MNIELTLDEETLLSTFRRLDQAGRKELLRHALEQYQIEAAVIGSDPTGHKGQCRVRRGEGRPETFAEPIFTE